MMKMINKEVKSIILFLIIASALVVAGCSTKYVCFDGSIQKNADKCPEYPIPAKTEREAKLSVENYGSAYAMAKGDRFTLVNLYASKGNWFADVLFTNSKNGEVKQVKLSINGKTGSVDCSEGCDYLGLGNSTNTTSDAST